MEQRLPVKAPTTAADHLLNAVCILPFEATLLNLYKNDKEALEELMRALIHLHSINVHIIIYTTGAKKEEVLIILKEYAPSKYFISENDIFCLTTMTELPEDMSLSDKEYHFINFCINYHNRTRPDDKITHDIFQERVLILHPDPAFFTAIDNKKDGLRYMGIHIDVARVYVELLEKIFIIFRENGRTAKIQEAAEIFRLAKDQTSEVLNDQKMMELHYQNKQLKIAEKIVDGLAKFLKRLNKVMQFIKAFMLLSRDKQAELLQDIQEKLEVRVRGELNSADLIEKKVVELRDRLPRLKFSYSFADLNMFQSLSTELWYSLTDELESQLEEPLGLLRKNKITHGELTPETLSALCIEELNDNQKYIIADYAEELERAPQQAQKSPTGEYYWLHIVGSKNEKLEKSALAKEIYLAELYAQLQEEIKFLQKPLSFERLNNHYATTAQQIAEQMERVGFMLGDRELEISEERNKNHHRADKIKNAALFESMYIAVKKKRQSRLSLARVIEDPFQLCRSGNVVDFINEVIRQQSAPYSLSDILLMLNVRVNNFKEGCEHLLKGKENGEYSDHDNYKYYVLLTSSITAIATDKTFAEVRSLFALSRQELRIKILFPYCINQLDNYWAAGEIKIIKINNQYVVDITLHDSCGVAKPTVTQYKGWCANLEKQLKQIDPAANCQFRYINSQYAARLHESERANTSVMVVDDIIHRVLGNSLNALQKGDGLTPTKRTFFPKGLHEIRAAHIKLLLGSLGKSDVRRQMFLKHHPDINQVGDHKKTLLETAAQHGQVKILQFLVEEMYADCNFSQSGFHPIFSILLGLHNYPSRTESLRIMLRSAGNSSVNNSSRILLDRKTVDVNGTPVLHFAVTLGVDKAIEILLEWGVTHLGTVPLYFRNQKNTTALYEALCVSKYGKLRGAVELLLKHGLGLTSEEVDKARKDLEKQELEKVRNQLEMKEGDKARSDLEVKPEMIKVVNDFLTELLKTLNDLPSVPTTSRLRGGSFGLVFSHMIRSVSYQWTSPMLQHCAENKTDKLLKQQSKVQSELSPAVQLDTKDERGFTAIIPACVCGKIDTLDFLLNYDVDVNIVTSNKIDRKVVGNDDAPELELATHLTPLHYAVLCQKDSHLFVKKLLAKHALIIPDSLQCTPLYYAVGRNNETVRLLLENLGSIGQLETARIADKNGITPFVKAVLTADKKCISHFIDCGYWPSAQEIESLRKEMVKKENCADIKKVFCEAIELLKSRLQPANSKELLQYRPKPKALNFDPPPRLLRTNSQPNSVMHPIPSLSSGVQHAVSPRKGSDLVTSPRINNETANVASPRGSGSEIITSPRKDNVTTSVAQSRGNVAEIITSPRKDNETTRLAPPLSSGAEKITSPRINNETTRLAPPLSSGAEKITSPRKDNETASKVTPRSGSEIVDWTCLLNETTKMASSPSTPSIAASPRKDVGTIIQGSLRTGGFFAAATPSNVSEQGGTFSPRVGSEPLKVSPRPEHVAVNNNSLRNGGEIANVLTSSSRPKRPG